VNFIGNVVWAALELVVAGALAVDLVVSEIVRMISNGIAIFI